MSELKPVNLTHATVANNAFVWVVSIGLHCVVNGQVGTRTATVSLSANNEFEAIGHAVVQAMDSSPGYCVNSINVVKVTCVPDES